MPVSDDDLDLIARTIVGEAAREPDEGQAGVGHVILNRLTSGRFGKDVPSVLFKPKQFEPWNTRAGELMALKAGNPAYDKALGIARGVAAGEIPDPTGGATHFANVATVRDRGNTSALGWLSRMTNVTRINNHTFGNADAGAGDSRSYSLPEGGAQRSPGRGGGGAHPDAEWVNTAIQELLADLLSEEGHAVSEEPAGGIGQNAGLGLMTRLMADTGSGPAPERGDML